MTKAQVKATLKKVRAKKPLNARDKAVLRKLLKRARAVKKKITK